MILYLHGFASSSQSSKAAFFSRQLRPHGSRIGLRQRVLQLLERIHFRDGLEEFGQRSAAEAQGAHRLSAQGSLLFERGLGWLECRVTASYPGSDHTIFLAEVITAETTPTATEPRLDYESQWLRLGIKYSGQ